jgi:oxygen-dependent protoporphyrinogen oxidase
MQTFPLALARSLGDRVMTECEVQRIGRDREGTFETIFVESGTERSIGSDAVVISTPSYKAAQFLEPFSPMLANQLREIYYPPVTEFFLGFRIEQIRRPLDGFGFLVPEREQRNILGTIWSSSLFPDRAPAGCAALTTFVGGARQPEIAMLSDDRLLNTVMNDLRTILGINGEPVFTRITRWKEAIPQYTLGYPDLLKQIDRFERDNAGIFICSNFRGGISVGDCVMSSEQTAIKVREHLEQKVENKLESTTGR